MAEPTKRLGREPTEEMCQAGNDTFQFKELPGTVILENADEELVWHAMWDAATEAETPADARAAWLEEAAQLIEKGFHIQHPTKPAGVSAAYIEGDARRAAAIRALKNRSAP